MRHYLRHLFVPHESNSHRAKILHIDSLILAIALLFFSFSLFATIHNTYPSVLGISFNITQTDLLNITNKIRKQHGLSELKIDQELSKAAGNKATDMFKKNYWAHIAPDGVTPWVFIKGSGYDYLYAGENLARGFTTASDVVNAWMASPSHRENMLSPNYKDVGFAVSSGSLTGSDTILVVEELGSRFNDQSTADAPIAQAPTTAPEAQTAPANQNPTPFPIQAPNIPGNQVAVASLQQQPLVDIHSVSQNIIFIMIAIFIGVLLLDALIIERKKIARLVAHNLDHIIYLIVIFMSIIILGKGLIL